jgi:hypothetical protein
MMIAIVLLVLVEIVTYLVLLTRLANLVRARKPELFGAVGGLHAGDFLLMGFGTGDSLISKLEECRDELREERDIGQLMRWVRVAWCAQLVTMVVGLFVVIGT